MSGLRRRSIVVSFSFCSLSSVFMAYGPDAGAQAVVFEDLECLGIALNGQGAFHGEAVDVLPALRKLRCAHEKAGPGHDKRPLESAGNSPPSIRFLSWLKFLLESYKWKRTNQSGGASDGNFI